MFEVSAAVLGIGADLCQGRISQQSLSIVEARQSGRSSLGHLHSYTHTKVLTLLKVWNMLGIFGHFHLCNNTRLILHNVHDACNVLEAVCRQEFFVDLDSFRFSGPAKEKQK